MCGICGIVHLDSGPVDRGSVPGMTEAMRHRGPDDEGLYKADQVALGMRRLRIIDLEGGAQPIHNENSDIQVVFNGEIYNFRELRQELLMKGHSFHTQSDTEVIVHLYEEMGKDCVQPLRGMFAFAIWDEKRKRLILARDRLGVKPLHYYRQSNNTLLFASEVRALLASGLVPRRLDLRGLRSYLAYGSVQEPYTLVEDVYSLSPGHTLIWQNGNVNIERYWQLPPPESVRAERPADLSEQVRERLSESVRLRLVADVPLGAFLSGGIDSTAIVALMQQASSEPVRTFSIVFDEAAYDERAYSQAAADHIKTHHTELYLNSDDVRQAIPHVLSAFDQPSLDGLNTYFISKVVREAGLTVALSGVGGDELFGGYSGYRKALLLERWGSHLQRLPSPLRDLLATTITALPNRESLRKVVTLLETDKSPYFASRQVFSRAQVTDLLTSEALRASVGWEPERFAQIEAETAGYDPVNRISALELQTYMLSTLLRDTDQMSMAHALEVRVPLLDHVLVEYLFALNGTYKLNSNQPKPLLTYPLDDTIPRQCVHRPKQGFELPFAVWLRGSLQSEMKASFVDQSNAQAFPFTSGGLTSVWTQFEQNQLGWSRIWGLFVLRNWLTRHNLAL